MNQSASESIQMMISHSVTAKNTIRDCFALMKAKNFSDVDQKMQEITELLEKAQKLEKKLLAKQTLGDESIEAVQLLYASTHLLTTSVLFEAAAEMKQLYKLGFSC